IGSPAMNLCTVPLSSNGAVRFGGVDVPLPRGASNGRGRLVLGLRPESVEVVEELGADAFVFCVAEVDGETTKLVARTEARRAPDRGENVSLRPRPEEAHLFDADSGERLVAG